MNDQIVTETIQLAPAQLKPEDQVARAIKAAAFAFFTELKPMLVGLIKENSVAVDTAALHDEVVDTLTSKVDDLMNTRQFERRVNELAESAIYDYDFSDIVESGIEDYHFDFSDEMHESIERYDFTEKVDQGIDAAVAAARANPDHPLAKLIRTEVSAYFDNHSFNVTPS